MFLTGPGSFLSRLLESVVSLSPEERAYFLEGSSELEEAHAAVAIKGDSAVPESAEDEVDFHYVCFVPSSRDGRLYKLDGDCKGPIETGVVLGSSQKLLCDQALDVVRGYIQRAEGDTGFSLLALVRK